MTDNVIRNEDGSITFKDETTLTAEQVQEEIVLLTGEVDMFQHEVDIRTEKLRILKGE
jgi:hypothetical protein